MAMVQKYTESELTNKDLIELEAQQHLEEDDNTIKEEKEVQKKFTVNSLASVFSHFNIGLSKLESMDPNVGHFAKVSYIMNKILQCYHEIYKKKKKKTIQTNVNQFINSLPAEFADVKCNRLMTRYAGRKPYSASIGLPPLPVTDFLLNWLKKNATPSITHLDIKKNKDSLFSSIY